MKHVLAKTYGWDLDYIDRLPIKETNILLNCISIEIEREQAEIRRMQMKSRMR